MAWNTPKTDWATDDAIGTSDLNRIEENTDFIGSPGASIVSSTNLPITNYFHIVTGNTNIDHIAIVPGVKRVALKFSGNPTINNNVGSPGAGFASVICYNNANYPTDPTDLIEFIYDGTSWYQIINT